MKASGKITSSLASNKKTGLDEWSFKVSLAVDEIGTRKEAEEIFGKLLRTARGNQSLEESADTDENSTLDEGPKEDE